MQKHCKIEENTQTQELTKNVGETKRQAHARNARNIDRGAHFRERKNARDAVQCRPSGI